MSLDWNDRYQPRRQPDRTLRSMTPDDVPAAAALFDRVGWTLGPADWARLLHWSPDGCFVVEEEERGVIGTVSTTPYDTALAWIGMLIVDPDRQRQGIGRQLMRAALDYLIARGTARIMLDATEGGRPLYESMGFRRVVAVERWEGKASTYLGPRARAMQPEDVTAVLELDTVLFGLRRTHILARLLEEFPGLAWVDYERGQLEGYMLARRTPTGYYLGPWMSWTAVSAERLLRVALEQLQGENLTVNVPDNNARGLILMHNHNFRRLRHCTRMIYGDAAPVHGEPLAQLSVAALATG